jgi:hypothetical protein
MILIVGCGNDPVEQPGVDRSEEYYPLHVGKYIEYAVDSIVFDDAPGGNVKDTISFEVREELVATGLSGSLDTFYIIHRSRRNSPADPWKLTDVWSTYLDENNVLRNEENLIFLKMGFPLYEDLQWLGASYISPQTSIQVGTETLEPFEYWESSVIAIDQADTINGIIYPQGTVMQVIQTDSDDDLMKRYVHETYIRGIGMVARTDTILDSRCIDLGDFGPCIGKTWTQHASKGYILSQVMTAHN